MLGIGVLRITYGYIPGLLGWLQWTGVAFVIWGGIDTLKGRHWKLCFSSSLLLTLLLVLSLFSFPGAIIFLFPGGILPIVFICLRKREWES